ncbi:MAG: hypothetical protein E7455_00210 [Ruminococcaceae bacterium]|nr:hypothetical protein [Oscillospiraceae bacterium]
MFNWLKKHYHWIIVIVMMLQTTIYGGLANTLASIYTIPVTTELGMSRANFSLAAGSLVIVPITNAIYDALGSYDLVFRLSAVLSLFVLGLFFIIFAMAKKEQRAFEMRLASSESAQSK